MKHYYILNNSCTRFSIAKNVSVEEVNSYDELKLIHVDISQCTHLETNIFPYKNVDYITKRYVNHPAFKYDLYGLFDRQIRSVFVIREERAQGAKCLRIIDIIGNLNVSGLIFNQVQELLKSKQAEFVDCYNYGLLPGFFTKMGFREVSGDTIIPDYYHPFIREEMPLFFVTTPGLDAVIFKGDGDQDRPRGMDEFEKE